MALDRRLRVGAAPTRSTIFKDVHMDIDAENTLANAFDILDNVDDENSKRSALIIKISFYKTYAKAREIATGNIIDSVVYKCHEFPGFSCPFQGTIEDQYNQSWKTTFREFVFSKLWEYMIRKSIVITKYGFIPKNPWLDDYHAIIILP